VFVEIDPACPVPAVIVPLPSLVGLPGVPGDGVDVLVVPGIGVG
jgi:hypothetical protein